MMERPLTKHIRPGLGPLNLRDYTAAGGYEALKNVLGRMSPDDVTETVKQSNLKGRGGAGFQTGVKWALVPVTIDEGGKRFLVANADEMEPGAFKDRFLLEGNPHQLLEGIIISAYAVRADAAFVFIRGEYVDAARTIARAIEEAFHAGYLGNNILGSDFSLAVYIHASAGRYICGEETGLLNALEGKRAYPRWKPPFPQISGLWANPTVVNNVETLSCVPHIMAKGAQWFNSLSRTPGEGGTKIFGVSGKVRTPGCWELPMGTPFRELFEEYAGGMRDGRTLKGFLPGGASTDFLLAEHLDVAMDFGSVAKAGSRLGTGTVIAMDDGTCPVGFVLNLETFFARESCGWCTPCREGIPWIEKTLRAIEEGSGSIEDIDMLKHHVKYLAPGHTFCAFAPGAMEPLQSALRFFMDDIERHLNGKGCPWSGTWH